MGLRPELKMILNVFLKKTGSGDGDIGHLSSLELLAGLPCSWEGERFIKYKRIALRLWMDGKNM